MALTDAGHLNSNEDGHASFYQVARGVWVDSENIHQNVSTWRELFEESDGTWWMELSDAEHLDHTEAGADGRAEGSRAGKGSVASGWHAAREGRHAEGS